MLMEREIEVEKKTETFRSNTAWLCTVRAIENEVEVVAENGQNFVNNSAWQCTAKKTKIRVKKTEIERESETKITETKIEREAKRKTKIEETEEKDF